MQGYRIERHEGANSGWVTVESLWPAANQFPWQNTEITETYVDADVLPSVEYRYRIRTVNEWGISVPSYGGSVITGVDPPGLRIIPGRGRVTIGWDAPKDESITGYRITRRVEWGDEETVMTDTGRGVTEWADTRVSPNTAYAYRLQALRGGQPGSRSPYLLALTPPVTTPTNDISEPKSGDLPGSVDTTGRIEIGGSVTGVIESMDDRDWFAVEFEAGKTYHVRLSLKIEDGYQPANVNSPLRLHCLITAEGDALRDCPTGAWSRHQVEQSGRYYITVRPWQHVERFPGIHFNGPISYRIEVDHDIELKHDPSLADRLSSLGTAGEAEVGTWTSGHFHSQDLSDLYKVQLCGDRRYRVPAFFNYGPDADVAPNGRATVDVQTADTGVGVYDTSPYTFRAWQDGTYYLTMRRNKQVSTIYVDDVIGNAYYRDGHYRFLVEDLDGSPEFEALTPASEPENGDLPADSTTNGAAPQGISVTGEIETREDRDWFWLNLSDESCPDRVYLIEVLGAEPRTDTVSGSGLGETTVGGTLPHTEIRSVYDAEGNLVRYSGVPFQFDTNSDKGLTARNAAIMFTPLSKGTYFLEVTGFNGGTGTYTVLVRDITDTTVSEGPLTFTFFGADDFDESLLIGHIAPGLPAVGRDGDSNSDPDLWRLSVVPERRYRLTLTGSLGEDRLIQFILGRAWASPPGFVNDGVELEPGEEFVFQFSEVFEDVPDRNTIAIELQPSATYAETDFGKVPVVWHASVYLQGGLLDYTLQLTDITDSTDDYLGWETTTGTVAVGGSVTGTINEDHDVDWFKVALEASKTYRFRLRGAGSSGGTLADPYLRLTRTPSIFDGGIFGQAEVNDNRSTTDRDSELTYRMGSRGKDIFIEASAGGSAATGTGTYTIEVEEVTATEQAANTPATGVPGITGSPRPGETLTADTSGIADEDGLTDPQFTYQWVRMDPATAAETDIDGETEARYTVTAEDEGKALLVRVAFTDDAGNEESLKSYLMLVAPPLVEASNAPATGAPVIDGTPRVGETLAADISGIEDKDGLTDPQFTYQWVRMDPATEADEDTGTDIDDAEEETYVVTGDDVGRVLKVRVSFTDDAGNEESLTSEATEVVTGEATILTDRPHGLRAVARGGAVVLTWLAPEITREGADDYRIMRHRPELGEPDPLVYVDFTSTSDTTFVDTGVEPGVLYVYLVKAVINFFGDLGEASDPVEIRMPADGTGQQQPAPENSPATGRPGIDGTPEVGRELTAETSDISDADGLVNVTFSYRWLADDAPIDGATGDRYTLAAADEGKAIKVRVSFTDYAGNEESLESDATAAVRLPLTAEFLDAPTGHDGSAAFTFEVRYSEPFPLAARMMLEHAITVTNGTITEASRLDNPHDEADGIQPNREWRITVEPGGNGDVVIVLPITEDCDDTGAVCTADGRKLSNRTEITVPGNTPATGRPGIIGTPEVGRELTADTSAISDADGLTTATFSYRWLADDAPIADATGDRYTLLDADRGKAIRVRVTFTDDAGYEETLDSEATAAVTTPFTASVIAIPESHDGQSTFIFQMGFSEEPHTDFSYKTMRDHVFTVTNGEVTVAQRMTKGSNVGWKITVRPSGGGDVLIVLPVTGDCDDAGAVCTEDGRKLSNRLELIVPGPSTPATGQPRIKGTLEVGQELTADTSGISDADGLVDASFAYQWLADDAPIAEATNNTYILTDAEVGKAVEVRVSFTDDNGNAESLTSAATSAVAAAETE